MTKRLLRHCVCVLVLLVGCSGGAKRSPDAGGEGERVDGGFSNEGDTSNPSDDAGLAMAPRDAEVPALDARVNSAADASRDGATSPSDAASSGGDEGGRSEICGATTNWPRPFTGMSVAAQSVGTSSFGFLEGPVWVAQQGVLLFSDMDMGNVGSMGPPARIRRLRPPASFDVFAQTSNSNGLAIWQSGALLAATHDTQALSLFDLDTSARTQLAVLTDGKRFNSPNDLTVRSDGTIYFTDPDWQKTDSRPSETMTTAVYRLPPPLRMSGTNAALLIDDSLRNPNGVALSPDERTLYIGSSGAAIWKYNVAADGSVSNRTMFANTGASDGMTVDCAGNLYVSSGTVEVFAPDGSRLGDITLGGDPTNVAFGGADRKTLYITAGSRLYSVVLSVPGFPY